MRCVLCGAPNDCAQAAKGDATAGSGPAEPCWCVGRSFPSALLARATAADGGAACVCRRCLAEAEAEATEATRMTGG
ncbi:MAG: cysteine-rich CWC family protein [Deltaproteobacteria bacterium]|nr:cysteine-rich CWC family protein [Deltaproteobacteria bacterium]